MYMKKLIVSIVTIFLGVVATAQSNDPVIMTIDGKEVRKSEFLQIYLKNNPDPKFDKAALDEYVELFTKFKLKVNEAEALGYDTIPRLVRELEGYERQLANPYLIDSTMNEELVKQAYDRTQTEVRASHILIKLNDKTDDTLQVYNRLLKLKERIENGEDFSMVAMGKGGSEDPSVASNGGDLGFFTAFQMVYQFEDAAYNTEVGTVSMPFRTRFGYHILKVTDKRPARGTMKTAHIMVQVGKNDTEDKVEAAKGKINEIYDLLEKGEEFESLVRKYSDDPSSNGKGGELPEFGTGSSTRMVPEFEDAAFELKNDGDFSKPVRTDYGFHIIKRLSWEPVPEFEAMEKKLRSKVAKDARSQKTQASFVEKLKEEYGFKKKSPKTLSYFENVLDSTYFQGKFDSDQVTKNKPIFLLDKKKYTQKDFALYLEKNYRSIRRGAPIKNVITEQYAKWENETILNYERSKLPQKYPAYKALITEYHDGILLYEVMSDKVWNKAMKDTTGLQEYFEKNKDKYWWGKRYDADIFECYTMDAAKQTYGLLQSDTAKVSNVIKTVNEESELNVRHRSGKYDVDRNRFFDGDDLELGLNEIYKKDGKFYVVSVKEVLEPAQKEFSEAKGAVTSDYQNFLEAEWLKELEGKYKVVINEDVLYNLGK